MSNEVEFERLLSTLPENLVKLIDPEDYNKVNEIIIDLGRYFEYRVSSFRPILVDTVITKEHLEECLKNLSAFRSDGRVGIPQTLHRVSCVWDRNGEVVGLTYRVGRDIGGALEMIKDLVDKGSVLILGSPGRGKTSTLRKIARYLGEVKRTLVVDKSSEIGGESSPAHPSIGFSRRFEVPKGKTQENIMIYALESHTPECMIIDEISTEEEALAAITISQRGVKLIATAHGNSLENLINNPPLNHLIGSISEVTLTDESASKMNQGRKRRRERDSEPIFDFIVEMKDFDELHIYKNVGECVDELLRGSLVIPEIRKLLNDKVFVSQQFSIRTSSILPEHSNGTNKGYGKKVRT